MIDNKGKVIVGDDTLNDETCFGFKHCKTSWVSNDWLCLTNCPEPKNIQFQVT